MSTTAPQFPSQPAPQTAGRILVESLRLHGVDRVYCVPGESYLEVLDALHDVADDTERVNDFAAPVVINLLCRTGPFSGRWPPVVVD